MQPFNVHRMTQPGLSMGNNAHASPFKLPAVLDLPASKPLLVALQEQIKSGAPLVLDASEVETLTYPSIQILLAAMRSNGVSVARESVAFASAFEDLAIAWTKGQIADANEPANAAVADPSGAPSEISNPSQLSADTMAKRILTIDDSKTMRDMLMVTLTDAGFDVLQAVDGQDGLDVLGRERVDVIITDINMPKMDGYEVVRKLREDPSFDKTPILVLTTESDASKKNIAREAGATGWLVKPFDPDRLVATIRKVSP
jgi:two-component system, chemotaxis family, chemotaxis protein CheY